jgi:hypothetical protein
MGSGARMAVFRAIDDRVVRKRSRTLSPDELVKLLPVFKDIQDQGATQQTRCSDAVYVADGKPHKLEVAIIISEKLDREFLRRPWKKIAYV